MKLVLMGTWGQFGKAEQIALAFFQHPEPYGYATSPDKVKKLFIKHDLNLDYIIFEGSLKAQILSLGIFSAEEVAYLQSNTPLLCQCAEFFMNGFKLGHSVPGFSFTDYVVSINPYKPFEPLAHSMVLYPKSYEVLYALESPVAECFRACFRVEGTKEGDITIWDVSYEGGKK